MESDEKPSSRFRKLIQGISGLFPKPEQAPELVPAEEEPKKIIGKEEIMAILPHRGRALFLDKVTIASSKVIGEFAVTKEACDGHEFSGKAIFRGSDMLDMSAQLLGVWAAQYPDFQGKLAFVRQYGRAKFQGLVIAGDILQVEIGANDLKAELAIVPRMKKILITGQDFSLKVQGEQKAYIAFIELANVELPTEEAH